MSAPLETVRRARRADVAFVAASVAYYWLLSLVPACVLAFVVLQVAYGNALGDWVVGQLAPALSPWGRDLVRSAFADSSGAVGVAGIGVLALAWAWMRLYRTLERSFERVYGGRHSDGLPERALAAAVVVPAISIGMGFTMGGFLTMGSGVLWIGIQVLGIALALLPVFVTLPPSRPGFRTAMLGAVATAAAWTVLRFALDAYATYGAYSVAYGALGAVLLLVALLYLGAVSLLFSVSLTATLDA